jgi:hypothetical protein
MGQLCLRQSSRAMSSSTTPTTPPIPENGTVPPRPVPQAQRRPREYLPPKEVERLIALGRKNALFAGSQSGARTWAILASLINTAKLNDLDPHTYLADVLERMISGRTPVNRLDELLAWNWKAARDALATAAA